MHSCCLGCCTQGDHIMYNPMKIPLSVKETLSLITPGETTGINQDFPGETEKYVHLKLTLVHLSDLRSNVPFSGKFVTTYLAR